MTYSTSIPRAGLATAIRVLAAFAVIGSSVAVTALTVREGDSVAVVVPQAAVAPRPAAPAVAPSAAAPSAAVPAPVAPARGGAAPAASVPLAPAAPAKSAAPGTAIAITPGGSAAPAAPALALTPGTGPSASQPIAPGGTANASPFASQPTKPQPTCPLGWPAPAKQGGLASLIGLAPLAGAFSSEAFALGPVYQPLLQLVGPVLAEIEPVITQNAPLIAPIIQQAQGITAVVLEAILPYYGPYRQQLLDAEGELAKQLTPILDRVYNSEAASCLVAWEGQIIDQAHGGRITVASLAHPGTVVELGPK
ncbi:hypothetical protein [Antrihabitans cavernicola]|uniref:Uncharacterized protein n=1 Tax=Antrihabitans cavernicola TaxID=2495913 RepID=A0A5A7SB14_9NOCA|nr:hypothetical protein [Spelaeibacter cavernicola]KAA0022714.1 hypothetical protein FOY51_13630 [Spelaeibacter cavernicola]